MNAKLLSTVAVMAMCLVSCAVLVDIDETDATEGQTIDGITDLGAFNAFIEDDDPVFESNLSSPTEVYTGFFAASFDLKPSSIDSSTFYVAKNSACTIDINIGGGSHAVNVLNGSWYDIDFIDIPVDYEFKNHTDMYAFDPDNYQLEFIFSEVGDNYHIGFVTSDGLQYSIDFVVIDTPFDGNDSIIYTDLGSSDQYWSSDWNLSGQYRVFSGLITDWYLLVNDWYDFTDPLYFAVGTEFDTSNQYIVSITSGSGLTVTSSSITGVLDTPGIFYAIDDEGNRQQIIVIDTDTTVDVDSIDISGQNTVSVGNQITLTAVTGPSDATIRGVEWSIVSGESFISRISTTETATGGTITIQGVSDGVATIRATATDGSGVYKDFTVTVSTPQIVIGSTQDDVTITTAMQFLYTLDTNVTGCTVLVSGADWLTVNGNTVSGSPSSTGDYTVTLTVTKSGYLTATQTFTVTVVSPLGFSNEPSTGVIVYEI